MLMMPEIKDLENALMTSPSALIKKKE